MAESFRFSPEQGLPLALYVGQVRLNGHWKMADGGVVVYQRVLDFERMLMPGDALHLHVSYEELDGAVEFEPSKVAGLEAEKLLPLGSWARHPSTGLVGVVHGRAVYLEGTPMLYLKADDGTGNWVEESEVEPVMEECGPG